jgi:hypothetical protein
MIELKKSLTFKRANRTPQQIDDFVKLRFSNALISNVVIGDDSFSFTIYSRLPYENLVNQLVKERYSDSEEFAILRKALTEKTNEFYIYNAYVEECKTQAKAFIEERNKVLGV